MRQYPLLDIEAAWEDAHRTLQEIIDMADTLWTQSHGTWRGIFQLGAKAIQAKIDLGKIPSGLAPQIAREQADFDEEGSQSPH